MATDCRHWPISVTRTFDLRQELAVCEDCGEEVPDWELRRHVPGKSSYFYKFVSTDDFRKLKGAAISERTG